MPTTRGGDPFAPDVSAKRVAAGEEPFRGGPARNDHRLSTEHVAGVEVAPGDEGNAEGLEVAGRYGAETRAEAIGQRRLEAIHEHAGVGRPRPRGG